MFSPRRRHLALNGLIDKLLVVPTRPPGIEPGIHHRSLAVLVPQQLSHPRKVAGVCIEHDLCAEMTELMRGEFDACAPLCVFANQVSHGGLRFGGPIGIHEQTLWAMTDMRGRDLVAIFHQHFNQMRWDIEAERIIVFDLFRIEFERRRSSRSGSQEDVRIKFQLSKIF